MLSGTLLWTAMPTQAAVQWLPYTDISKNWAKKEIVSAVEKGLFVAGKENPRFFPQRPMTRAEFLTLLDRLFTLGQDQLYSLTLTSGADHLVETNGTEEPYLPYRDVDRLTWMYEPILRVSVVLERLYGPQAIQNIFPGKEFHPEQPITWQESANLIQMFVTAAPEKKALQILSERGWLDGNQSKPLTRADAAVLADKVSAYLEQGEVLPLLDYDGQKFPQVPYIENIFPLFYGYLKNSTGDDKVFLDSVTAVSNQMDNPDTYRRLEALGKAGYPNQVGIHYYLSWNPDTDLSQNLNEAIAAIDAYYADKIVIPETLKLLMANVYDICLQIEYTDPQIYEQTLPRLYGYEQKMKQGSEEWQQWAIYIAALEMKSGAMDKALAHYQQLTEIDAGLINTVYYLANQGRLGEAEEVLDNAGKRLKPDRKQLLITLADELNSLKKQPDYIRDLAYALKRTEAVRGYKVTGESTLSGYLFHYTQVFDEKTKASHTTGFFQSPYKLVKEKLETYDDYRNNVQYSYDFEQQKWTKTKTGSFDYLHEWVESQSVEQRAEQLGARYLQQSFGSYDVITEWIPGDKLVKSADSIEFDSARIKRVPMYVNKYYVDRRSGFVVRHIWRYEEVYDSNEYAAYSGQETYGDYDQVKMVIPATISEQAGEEK